LSAISLSRSVSNMPLDANQLNDLGNELMDSGKINEAVSAFRQAIAAAPKWSAPWYNLGLLHKYQLEWQESATCNQRAIDLDVSNEAAWWNLGIAATALGDWALARRAWRGFGISVPDGDGPLDLGYGPVPIRLDPQGVGEVVWCTGLDPARAVISSVPLPASPYREGDTVLHDGAPEGTRTFNGKQVGVFNVLQLLHPSPRNTCEAWLIAVSESDITQLINIAAVSLIVVEDWTQTVRMICRQCSEGTPHPAHEPEVASWQPRRHVGLSADSIQQASSVLVQWASALESRQVLECRLIARPV
jgi:hypothetical protein